MTVLRSDPELALASASPRRRELLSLTGWDFTVCAASIPEEAKPGESPDGLAKRLAVTKAQAARKGCPSGTLTLAADTLVVHQQEVMGKPVDADEALLMLRQLRGLTHQVITAVALDLGDGDREIELCDTDVPMRLYSDGEIEIYVEGGSPFDKAGAYGIQDSSFRPVDSARFSGCFANVMGLPLCHLVRAMRRRGYATSEDVPGNCMQFTGYDCTIYSSILRSDA
jgi:MAF protein